MQLRCILLFKYDTSFLTLTPPNNVVFIYVFIALFFYQLTFAYLICLHILITGSLGARDR